MTRPSLDELIPWKAVAGVGVGAFVGDDGEQTYQLLTIKLLVKSSKQITIQNLKTPKVQK